MGLPLKKKITQKKQIQLLVRAQEGIQINFFSVRLKIFLIDFIKQGKFFVLVRESKSFTELSIN